MESGNWDNWKEWINEQHKKYNEPGSSIRTAEQSSRNERQSGAQTKER